MKHTLPLALASALALSTFACSQSENENGKPGNDKSRATTKEQAAMQAPTEHVNPFFKPSPLFFNYPEFDKIKITDYAPAFERGMADHLAEIKAIAEQTEAPTIDNTLVPLERSGQLLDRVSAVFFNLSAADTNDEMEKIRSEMAPKLAAHQDEIFLNSELFARIQALYEQRDSLGLDPETHRLVEETYRNFVRAGAKLSAEDKEKLKAMNTELASLKTTFSQNVLNEVNASAVEVDDRAKLDGMSEANINAAATAAKKRDMQGKYLIALLNTTQQPPLTNLKDRALRQRIMEASLARGSHGGPYDNRATLARIIELRAQRAQLLGYKNHAAYRLENQTAHTTTAVNDMLAKLTPPAVANARSEAADLQKVIDADGKDFQLQSWDWNFYAEKLRKQRYDFDEAQMKPYFEMNNVLQKGVFFAANRLYGLTFKERHDLPVYNPDVRVFEVFDADGSPLALFIMDYFARPSKNGGAWMNAYVTQSKLLGKHPVVANHLNITKPPEGEPVLLTFDEVKTMFHEFGHALHGMFSNVEYPSLAGTNVPRDFVEFPSQFNENWATWPEVLANYAVHYKTGQPLPKELMDKILATQKFNQGYATTEYLAAALLDQAWHQLSPEQVPGTDGVLAFEADALKNAGVALNAVPPRYRSTYFSHIMGGYSAGYYAYIWSEVLDVDSFEWFKQHGGLTHANGDFFRKTVLSRGNSEDPMAQFKAFTGRGPYIEPLLERRGLN